MKQTRPRYVSVFVRPSREGLQVPVPGKVRARLPKEGALVPLDPYWSRRILKGDVLTDPDPAPEALSNRVVDAPLDTNPAKRKS